MLWDIDCILMLYSHLARVGTRQSIFSFTFYYHLAVIIIMVTFVCTSNIKVNVYGKRLGLWITIIGHIIRWVTGNSMHERTVNILTRMSEDELSMVKGWWVIFVGHTLKAGNMTVAKSEKVTREKKHHYIILF